jgi:ElaB/YqjD/DUF883 family membrane-anchored ribosome-binding protein
MQAGTHALQLAEQKGTLIMSASTERAVVDLKRVVGDSEQLLQDTAQIVGEKAQAIGHSLAEKYESAKDAGRKVGQKAAGGAQAADRVIRDHPHYAIAVGIGLGALIGALLRRR